MNHSFDEVKNELISIEKESGYNFGFNKKATEKEVALFEKKFNVTLPNDYRRFIIEIGNGGFGFEYFNLNHYIHKVNVSDRITKEFPLSEKYNEDENEYHISDDELNNGRINLEWTGCGTHYFLVVNGAESGNIWCNDLESNGEIYPLTHKINYSGDYSVEKHQDFIIWFLKFLTLHNFENKKQ